MRIAVALAYILFLQMISLVHAQSEELPPPRLIRRNPLVIPPSSGPIKRRAAKQIVLDLQTVDQVQYTESNSESLPKPMPASDALPVHIADYLQGAAVSQPETLPKLAERSVTNNAEPSSNWHQPVSQVNPQWVQSQTKTAADKLEYQTPRQEDVWVTAQNSTRVPAVKAATETGYVTGSDQISAPPPPLEKIDRDRSAEYNPPAANRKPLPMPDAHSNSVWQPIESMTEACLPYYTESYYEANGPCEECWVPQNHWVQQSDFQQHCDCEASPSRSCSCSTELGATGQCPDCLSQSRLWSEFSPFILLGAKGGNDRSLGEIQAMLPLWQSDYDLLFGDIQGRFSDGEESEGHFGLGFRTSFDTKWILGTYAYYDLRKTFVRNRFNQLTLGVELMSEEWDFRVNGYFPNEGGKSSSRATGLSNGTIVTNAFEERAYSGIYAEVGRRILHWGRFDSNEVRWFVGYSAFDTQASGFQKIDGPRSRVEYRSYDLPFLGPQSRLTAGVEYSNDNLRDDQYWGYLRVQIPLAPKDNRTPLDPMRRRYLDPTVRVID